MANAGDVDYVVVGAVVAVVPPARQSAELGATFYLLQVQEVSPMSMEAEVFTGQYLGIPAGGNQFQGKYNLCWEDLDDEQEVQHHCRPSGNSCEPMLREFEMSEVLTRVTLDNQRRLMTSESLLSLVDPLIISKSALHQVGVHGHVHAYLHLHKTSMTREGSQPELCPRPLHRLVRWQLTTVRNLRCIQKGHGSSARWKN
jgi:hypothetical protein